MSCTAFNLCVRRVVVVFPRFGFGVIGVIGVLGVFGVFDFDGVFGSSKNTCPYLSLCGRGVNGTFGEGGNNVFSRTILPASTYVESQKKRMNIRIVNETAFY